MAAQQTSPEHLLTPAEVAALVFVDPKTVSRWAQRGKIPSTRTLGGHRRFRRSDVQALMPRQRRSGDVVVAEAVASFAAVRAAAAAQAAAAAPATPPMTEQSYDLMMVPESTMPPVTAPNNTP